MIIYPEKTVEMEVVPSMDFVNLINGRTVISFSVSMIIFRDAQYTDPNPAAMLDGPATMQSTVVLQKIKGGVAGVDYMINFLVTYTDGTSDTAQGRLNVVKFLS